MPLDILLYNNIPDLMGDFAFKNTGYDTFIKKCNTTCMSNVNKNTFFKIANDLCTIPVEGKSFCRVKNDDKIAEQVFNEVFGKLKNIGVIKCNDKFCEVNKKIWKKTKKKEFIDYGLSAIKSDNDINNGDWKNSKEYRIMKYYITSFDKDNIPSTLSNKIFELPNFCSKSCQNDKNCSTDCENLKKIINKKKNQLNYRYMIKRWEDDKRIICVKDLCRLHK